jgi:acetylornithine deacetylase/succinyl-diaminopimelate desuccinylase-like protein
MTPIASLGRRGIAGALLSAGLALPSYALLAQAPLSADQREARDVLRQLVNINSTTGTIGVKRAAEAMARRFTLAGFSAADVRLLGPTPELTALVVRYRGRAAGKKPILLMAHLDVVPAKRADWPFDPFVMQEKDGWYYGRGAEDDKAGVATIVSTLLRYKRERYVPDRDLYAVFTADEETDSKSIVWLLKNHAPLREAEYALNADAGNVNLDGGKAVSNTLQASEKVFANFAVEATNPGGHSSVPRKDNAIYDLSIALAAFSQHEFPIRLNEVSRAFFKQSAGTQAPEVQALMRATAAEPTDMAAATKLAGTNPYFSSVMRTTCVATLLAGGHAENALPQRATANINCRMLPDERPDSVRATLQRVMGGKVTVRPDGEPTASPVSPLRSDLVSIVERLTTTQFPGAVVVPEMSTGATDGLYTRNAGIPTYGITAVAFEQNEPSRAHGQEERVGVKAFHDAVTFWYSMVKALTTPTITP